MRVVVLGAGISGHTAAAFLKKKLGKKHDVVVVSPSQYYQWVPSNIWVGVGRMSVDQVRFKLEKVYNRWGIDYKQAKVTTIYPEGDSTSEKGFVEIVYTKLPKDWGRGKIRCRYVRTIMQPTRGKNCKKALN